MANEKETLLQQIQSIRDELGQLLDGMGYCLDWKPSDEEWSARQVLYHLIGVPTGGLHTTAQLVLRGELKGITMVSGATNVTPERQGTSLEQIMEETNAILAGLEQVVSSNSDIDLEGKKVNVSFLESQAPNERSVGELIGRNLEIHWRDHLGQLATLREALGVG